MQAADAQTEKFSLLEFQQPIQLKLSDQKSFYVFPYSTPMGEARTENWKKIIGFFGELLLIVTANSKNVQGQKFGKKIVGFWGRIEAKKNCF